MTCILHQFQDRIQGRDSGVLVFLLLLILFLLLLVLLMIMLSKRYFFSVFVKKKGFNAKVDDPLAQI
jgi:hypothetical protein